MKYCYWVSLMSLLMSCSKEELLTEAPSLVGTWQHYSAEDAWEIIFINTDGTGKVEWYVNNKLNEETKEKNWYTKDNRLYLGKATFSFKPYNIDAYPYYVGTSDNVGFDTLTPGKRIIELNQLHYIEKD